MARISKSEDAVYGELLFCVNLRHNFPRLSFLQC